MKFMFISLLIAIIHSIKIDATPFRWWNCEFAKINRRFFFFHLDDNQCIERYKYIKIEISPHVSE